MWVLSQTERSFYCSLLQTKMFRGAAAGFVILCTTLLFQKSCCVLNSCRCMHGFMAIYKHLFSVSVLVSYRIKSFKWVLRILSTTTLQIRELSSWFYKVSHNVWHRQRYYSAYSYKLIFNFSNYNVTNCIFAPDAITDIQLFGSALLFLDWGVPYSLIFPSKSGSWNLETEAQPFL